MPLLILGIIAILTTAVLLNQSDSAPTPNQKTDRLTIIASFYPLAEFTRQVGGDLVSISTMTPAGVEPHEYEPSPKDLTATYSADALVYNGAGVDPWAERIEHDLQASGVTTLNMSKLIPLLPGTTHEKEGEEHAEENERNEQFDPHFWLSPALAVVEVNAIRDLLIKLDPANAQTYTANAAAYSEKLNDLDQAYHLGLQNCALDTIVTSHSAFSYLANAYRFTILTISGLSPEDEPSAGHLSELAEIAKEKQIKYIYFETLVSPALAKTLAAEIGAQTLVLNPLEGLTDEETDAGVDYLSIQQDNLAALKTGLMCP